METLQIRLFGGFHLSRTKGGGACTSLTRSLQSFLAYLILNRERLVPREVLVGIFWGENSEERARNCLSTALWRLRCVLEPPEIPRGTYLTTNSGNDVGFNAASNHWLDVSILEQTGSRVLAKPVQTMSIHDARELEESTALYAGDLLEGFYDDWALQERERIRSLYLESLAHLMHYYRERGRFEKGVMCGRRILSKEPLREEIHRELMRMYRDSGQPTRAVRQYQACCQVLDRELGVPPMEETQALYMSILRSNRVRITAPSAESSRPDAPSKRATVRQAVDQLQAAVRRLQETTDQLQHAIRILGEIMENEIGEPADPSVGLQRKR